MVTVQIPINYVEVICEASIADTLGWEEQYGGLMRKRGGNDDYNRAWLEACTAINNAPRNPRRGYTITVSTLAAQTLVDDMRWWSEYEVRTTITYAQTRQCAKTANRIEAQINKEAK